MNKEECIARADRAAVAAKEAAARFLSLALALGIRDSLVLSADTEAQRAASAAHRWRTLAKMNAQARKKLLRTEALPVSMFGY